MVQRPLFDPTAPGFRENPYPFYARLRQAEPWHLSPLGFYVVSRFEDVNFVLRDRRFGTNWIGPKVHKPDPRILETPIFRSIATWLLQLDPPDHTRVRSCFAQVFTARRVEAMRKDIEKIVERIVDEVQPRGRMDAVTDFALAIPLTVINDMLGVPEEDRELMFRLSRFAVGISDPVPLDPALVDRVNKDFLVIADYFERLIEERRKRPGEDLVSLITAAAERERLSSVEMVGNLVFLFAAGHETTAGLIGNALMALDGHPDQLRLLLNDRTLMPQAVTELMRYDPSVHAVSRAALEDVEFNDVKIAKGQQVMALLGAANRDPSVFPSPDTLDIQRPEKPLLTFGAGIHHCLGSQLARLQLECALGTLLKRIPDFSLVDSAAAPRLPSVVLRGPASLQAVWPVRS